jgi:hypothetical protein
MPFKKGGKSHNAHPIGFVRDDGNGYLEKKIDIGKWKKLHVIIWEAVNGPVPNKHKIVFIDKNKLNFNIDNLQCLSYREVLDRITIHNYPDDLRYAMKTLKKLKKQLNNGTKQN